MSADHDELSDEQFMLVIQGREPGWEACLEALWHARGYEMEVYGYLVSWARTDADLPTQEVLLRIWRTTTYDPSKGLFRAYIRRVAWRTFCSWCERRDRHRRAAVPIEEVPEAEAPSREADHEWFEQNLRRMEEALQCLTTAERTVLQAWAEGRSYAEIAEDLYMTIRETYQLHFRTKNRIRDQFTREDWLEEHHDIVNGSLQILSPNQRKVIRSRQSGDSYEQSATHVGLDRRKVWQLLYEGVGRLMEHAGKAGH